MVSAQDDLTEQERWGTDRGQRAMASLLKAFATARGRIDVLDTAVGRLRDRGKAAEDRLTALEARVDALEHPPVP
jgi:hypothetical protein